METKNICDLLTDEERQKALEKARENRKKRTMVRRQLHDGELTMHDVLHSDEEYVKRMPVSLLLRSLPGIGYAKAEAVMASFGIAPSRRIRGLGLRQRAKLDEWYVQHFGN